MLSLLHRSLASLLVSVALTGCDEFAPDTDVAEDDEVTDRGYPLCPKCQFNAATINGFPISALDITGELNDDGVAIEHIRDPEGVVYRFGVINEEFAALAGDDEKPVAYAADVVGWDLVFTVKGISRAIRIEGRKELPSWAKATPPISVYTLEGSFDDGPPRNVCPTQTSSATALTIIHGETYDGELKQVDQIGKEWITLACVDEAAYKVKRMGYGPHGNQGKNGAPATPEQRTATLKMLTADFCGTGHSFTNYHTEFYFRNPASTVTVPDYSGFVSPEAVWDENGAVCLTKARAGQWQAIKAMCDLPNCNDYLKTVPLPPWEWKTYVPIYPYTYWSLPY